MFDHFVGLVLKELTLDSSDNPVQQITHILLRAETSKLFPIFVVLPVLFIKGYNLL